MLDLPVTLAGLLVGLVVGLTGMGGGALMTPILVLVFGVSPLAAVSSDLVASFVMKPVGGAVHWRRGTVHRGLVLWLMIGSVPTAFLGVVLLKSMGTGAELQSIIKYGLGIALLVVVTAMLLRPLMMRGHKLAPAGQPLVVKRVPTVLIGIVGGLVVGITSVGSGSLMVVMLLLLYPRIRLSELVGTDLVQAIPLVGSAALGHILFGNFQLGLTASILLGSIPGVYLGARLSAKAPDHVIRPALVVVLGASALRLLGLPTLVVGALAGILTIGGVVYAMGQARKLAQQRAAATTVRADAG